MNAIRCPNCSAANPLAAAQCKVCGASFASLPSTAYVSVPVGEIYGESAAPAAVQDNETGRKTFFWYRIYCGFMLALYLAVIVGGVLLAVYQPENKEYGAQETMFMGIIYAFVGVVLAGMFGTALFLPRKPYNWIIGIVMIALGMTSCCFLPFLVPMLIFWIKPETKAYFGRK